jgi:hypothetical protein
LQRYSKLPCLEEIEGEERVGIAFDNMVVRPDNLNAISNMYPALKRWAPRERIKCFLCAK